MAKQYTYVFEFNVEEPLDLRYQDLIKKVRARSKDEAREKFYDWADNEGLVIELDWLKSSTDPSL